MTRGLLIGSAAALASVVLLSFVAGSDATRSGQVLFVPGPAPVEQILDEGLGSVTVTACEVTPTGLKVLGYVPTGPERMAWGARFTGRSTGRRAVDRAGRMGSRARARVSHCDPAVGEPRLAHPDRRS